MHTPGPWKVIANGSEMLIGFGSDSYLANTFNIPSQVANARLIAAAPELLEACEKAADYLLGIGLDTDEDGEPSPEYTRLILAIAKARGKE